MPQWKSHNNFDLNKLWSMALKFVIVLCCSSYAVVAQTFSIWKSCNFIALTISRGAMLKLGEKHIVYTFYHTTQPHVYTYMLWLFVLMVVEGMGVRIMARRRRSWWRSWRWMAWWTWWWTAASRRQRCRSTKCIFLKILQKIRKLKNFTNCSEALKRQPEALRWIAIDPHVSLEHSLPNYYSQLTEVSVRMQQVVMKGWWSWQSVMDEMWVSLVFYKTKNSKQLSQGELEREVKGSLS